MASILRQIVAGPRSRHPEAGLDLCYVTDNIIATSGPSSTYPQRAYRNPTDDLVKWLDYKHGENWSIWEFRAEGTGYPDSEVYGRIRHYPWPDHHPPPFALIPNIMASMRNWLKSTEVKSGKRVVVVHCKAGKGRSGTIACSYLISEEEWKVSDALARFTQRRMRPGFGNGVSIPSQLRWIKYVDTWTKTGKVYLERPVEILEVHAWGLRDGVKVAVEGYIEEGRKIKTIHVFKKEERLIVDGTDPSDDTSENSKNNRTAGLSVSNSVRSARNGSQSKIPSSAIKHTMTDGSALIDSDNQHLTTPSKPEHAGAEIGGKAVIFRPSARILVPTSDVCIDLERRNRAPYGWTMVTAVAHVWFNAFFEGIPAPSLVQSNSASSGLRSDQGVFEIEWDALDGLKGSSKKGTRALDKLAVVWKVVGGPEEGGVTKVITQPAPGEKVPDVKAADWKGSEAQSEGQESKTLGMRIQVPSSKDVSRASSVEGAKVEKDRGECQGADKRGSQDYEDSVKEVKTHGIEIEDA